MSVFNIIRRVPLNRLVLRRYCSSTSPDAPVKFTTSKASSWKAEYSRTGTGTPDEAVWYQPISVVASVAVFLLYFCVLREENDVDEAISGSIFDKIEGLEEFQLRKVLEYNLDHGIDASRIVARLKEIENAKQNQN